jgi:hypothetical protein
MLKRAAARGLVVTMEEYDQIVPDCTDKKHRSFKGFWLLLWFHLRKIQKGAAVHVSAIKRMEKVKSYRPRRLCKVQDTVRIIDEDTEG